MSEHANDIYARRFEGCPECGKDDGYINAGRSHFLVCDEHRLVWSIGFNLFSSCKDETEEEQREAWKRVVGYRDCTIRKELWPSVLPLEVDPEKLVDDVPF